MLEVGGRARVVMKGWRAYPLDAVEPPTFEVEVASGAVPCGRCPARIVWTITARGKRMPIDARPVVDEPGLVLYEPHWATCPAAGEFRRGR